MKVYGIKNCDTVQKALNWLKERQINFEFHDFKKEGIGEEKLNEWADKLGWENLLNKKGLTWKKLDPEVQQSITSQQTAVELMQEKTSVIKRPVIESGDILLNGFNDQVYTEQLK